MLGYYNNEAATSEVLKDGWFYRRFGKIDDDGFIYICGRKKSVIVLKKRKKYISRRNGKLNK